MSDRIFDLLERDYVEYEVYYRGSITKTEQQKFLEKLLGSRDDRKYKIADVGCGGGTLSYHLKHMFPSAEFYLYDYFDKAIEVAKEVNKNSNFNYSVDNIYDMHVENNYFDYTFCCQTLVWLDKPQEALSELVRITKPGGKVYVCSLFNLDHDVDICTKTIDYTRNSGKNNIAMYNYTYSLYTIKNCLKSQVTNWIIHKFIMEIDLPPPPSRGIGTYTKKIEGSNERMQISGGVLYNWGILEITK
jgi:ubiquinone/menaquinone biosynthesis C-methylase UbiE